jgi:rubrerythrin
MALRKGWRKILADVFNIFSDGRHVALEGLAEHYIEASQHARRITYHAERMQYPQFREKLRAIAAEESKHAQWIAETIRSLGGTPPDVPEVSFAAKNSWEYLLAALEERRKCAAELLTQIYMLRAEYPQVADTLERIYDDGARHSAEIRAMLMRSDPQAHWAA